MHHSIGGRYFSDSFLPTLPKETSQMKAQDNSEHKEADNRTGCGGCLRNMLIILIGLVLFIVIYDRITVIRYKKNPTGAQKEVVEGYAGVEFPPYRLVETILSPEKGRFEYVDTLKMEFLTTPDSAFYEAIRTACRNEYLLGSGKNQTKYKPWYFNEEKNKFHFNFWAFYNQAIYDTVRNTFLSRGVPKEFLAGDRLYEIHLPVDSKEWTIVTGIH